MGELEARIQVVVADRTRDWVALPSWGSVSVGRRAGSGLHLPDSWVPRGVCRFTPCELGWLVQVGPRARMRLRDPWVVDHVFNRRALVALQEGPALLTFPELDDELRLGLVVGRGEARGLPVLEDDPGAADPEGDAIGTAHAAGRLDLPDTQREVLAVAYRHLLLAGEPSPRNLAKAAAERLGKSPQAVTNTLTKVRDRINLERWGPELKDSEQLGDYLVHLTRTLMWTDLPERHR